MNLGQDREHILDPINIYGDRPKGQGIFADTSYADLPAAESDAFTLPKPKAGHFALLALLAAGLYLTAKS